MHKKIRLLLLIILPGIQDFLTIKTNSMSGLPLAAGYCIVIFGQKGEAKFTRTYNRYERIQVYNSHDRIQEYNGYECVLYIEHENKRLLATNLSIHWIELQESLLITYYF